MINIQEEEPSKTRNDTPAEGVECAMTARQSPRQARVREILREIGKIGYALPGSVVIRATACGKPVCRCKADPPQLHGPYVSWIRKSGDNHDPAGRRPTAPHVRITGLAA